jgi:hypothetical protein
MCRHLNNNMPNKQWKPPHRGLRSKPKSGGFFNLYYFLKFTKCGGMVMATNLTVQQKKDVAFWALIVSGVGCCVGGAFFPPLIPVGAALLSGAIAIARDAPPSSERNTQAHQPNRADDNQSSSSGENVDVNVQVDLTHRHHARSRQFTDPIPNEPNIEHKENPDRDVSKRHKHRP